MTTTAQEIQTTQVYQLYIRATPEQIWAGITQPEHIERYFHGCRLDGPLVADGRWVAHNPDRTKLWIDSEIVEFDPPKRLQHTWIALYDDELALEGESRVTWEIEPRDDGTCLLIVVHDRLENAPKTAASVAGAGWMHVLSGLKTLLETGTPLFDYGEREEAE
jgi:uncharacterized protein YndB with AHSA1/START domain